MEIFGVVAPWIIMVAGLAIYLLKAYDNKRTYGNGPKPRTFSTLGLFLGIILGVGLGLAFGHMNIWIAPGMCIGLAIGCCIERDIPQD